MKTIELTRGYVTVVDDEDYEFLKNFSWHAYPFKHTVYAGRRYRGEDGVQRCMLMHRDIMKPGPNEQVDHLNGDGLGNRRINLRICSGAENRRNRRKHMTATSKFKGVSWIKAEQKWKVTAGGLHVGYFSDERAAARAYDKFALKLFKEFACLNFP